MGRPFTASDEEVLEAAARVLLRRGPDAFSVAEVASEVGLGRAAIILRFKSTHDLKVTLLTQLVEKFAAGIAAVPKPRGGDGLLHLAAFIGSCVRSRENGAKAFMNFSSNLEHRDLIELEAKRGVILCTAISDVMPKVPTDRESAVTAFLAHITGSIIAWLSLEDDNPRRYLVMRTREWLKLAAIPFSARLVDELSVFSPPTPADNERAPSKPVHAKTAARAKAKSRGAR